MRDVSLWRGLLGVEKTVIERVEFDGDAERLVAHARPIKRQRNRCGICGRRSPGYDGGPGRRRWRSLDLGTVRAVLEADAPRVECRDHGVVVAAVPWARHDAGHTRAFDDQVAWLATQASKTTATELMRIAWRTVGSIIARVWADVDAQHDRFAGLRRIGIDEISYKKGHRYLMVVVDHDARRLVWAAPGRSSATVNEFFDLLTENQQVKLAWIAATDPRLYRAYLLKEGLRVVFQLPYDQAVEALDRWISWARRCRIPAFVKLQKSIVKHRARILAAIEHNLSNGLIESTNTKIRLITRMAFGFKSAGALIALALLSLGGHRPTLPGRR